MLKLTFTKRPEYISIFKEDFYSEKFMVSS